MLCQANYTCGECREFFTTHIRIWIISSSYAVTINFSFRKLEKCFRHEQMYM